MLDLRARVLVCVAALAGSVTGDAFVSIDRATVARGPARGRAAATFRATSLAGSASGSASIVPDVPAIKDMGAEEVEEGKEDEAAGERDEEAARDHHDESEMQEGEDEVQAGAIEEQRGEAKEAEYLSDHEFKKVIEVKGLDEKDFDEVKFQEAVAETLGVELFEVSVGALDQGRRRRLLAAQRVIAVPVTVECDGPAACSRLRGQLEGNICNGGLGRALSEVFGVRISTPGCQQHLVPALPHEPQYISFPDAYPNSVRHWLLIGMLSMCLGAGVVFIFTFVPAKTPPMANVLVFMILSVAMCAYYCMWAGVFVDFKTSDDTPRVIFYPKYLDWIVTCPLTLAVICLVADADSELLVSMAGNAILMVLCGLVGSTIVAPYKYIWWVLGVVFLLIILMILGRVMRLPRNGRAVRRLVLLTAGVWVLYPIVWITGSEGTAALGLTQEVALTCGLDLVAKVAFAVVSAIACRLTQDEVLAQMPTNCASY